ncbi:MAG: hypothetical protein F4166_05390, partial [Gammaproteobacteria bacterium]|nr:hypothetical protein [Gammaproteobacteria bacterium]
MATATMNWGTYTTVVRGGSYGVNTVFSEIVSGLSTSTSPAFAIGYTITGDATLFRYNSNTDTVYTYVLRTSSSWGDRGGSVRIQLPRTAVTPNLDEDLDWTLGWNASGEVYAERTADMVFPELAITLSDSIVPVSGNTIATFTFTEAGSATISDFTADDITVTDGITKGALTKVSNTVYTMPLTMPASGNGEGVVSVAADVINPRNTAATATFTYIDRVNAEISLSAAAISNGGTIIAQFDFDYDVPDFSSDIVAVNNPGAVKGNATNVDDRNRCWIVPVEVPQAGEGELEIELPDDAIGFYQSAVRAQVQFAPKITLHISATDNNVIAWVINTDNNGGHEIEIEGDNISSVDVEGLLRPFYHEWVPNNGNAKGM